MATLESLSSPRPPYKAATSSNSLQSRLDAVDCLLRNLNHGSSSSSRQSNHHSAPQPPLPLHLQDSFDALYKELEHALLEGRNGSALLMGPPACGKSLVLEAVLQKLTNESTAASSSSTQRTTRTPLFRKVVIDGRVLPGHATGRVVHEILRQLTESALADKHDDDDVTSNENVDQDEASSLPSPMKRHKKMSSHRNHLLRLRKKNSFVSHMDLLNQILQIAAMDNTPVLIVLRHLECFVGVSGGTVASNSSNNSNNSNPQLLLYHLLDRIGQADCGLALVATSRHSGVLGLLEKRIQSRVHGSCKCIHFSSSSGGCWDKSHVQIMLLDKLVHASRFEMAATTAAAVAAATDDGSPGAGVGQESNGTDEEDEATELSKEIGTVLVADPSQLAASADLDYKDDAVRVRAMLQRSLSLGRDVRWFLRVASLALSMYREDCRRALSGTTGSLPGTPVATCLHTARYWLEALQDMGASMMTGSGQFDPCKTARMQVLSDLNGPQVALLLSARRILVRDTQKADDIRIILTFERIVLEYRRYQGTSNRYKGPLLRRAFKELLQLDIFRPAMDHAGTGPFQYQHSSLHWDVHTLARVPLHLTYDVHGELKLALERNMFAVASTALVEWAKKIS